MRQPTKAALYAEIERLRAVADYALEQWEAATKPKPSMWQIVRGWFA